VISGTGGVTNPVQSRSVSAASVKTPALNSRVTTSLTRKGISLMSAMGTPFYVNAVFDGT
jgi:hypothetical protein